MALKLTSENFENEVLKSQEPFLVDFYADWCGPCQMLAPIIEDISDSDIGVRVGTLHVDEEVPLALQYGVRSIPFLMLFKNGEVVAKTLGYQEKEEILKMIEDANVD